MRRPNEKGVVEGIVKYGRLNYFVPVPQVESFKELNSYLEQRCREDLLRRVRGQKTTKAELLSEERAAFLSLPAAEFDACRVLSTRVSSLSLVRFDCNDYSVPVRYAHWDVEVKGYAERVSICRQDEVIATHERRWEKEGIAFNPLHYLELLERKPGALDHARPLAKWTLPECFHDLRRRLESEDQRQGTREFIRVLRLLEKYSLARVERAVDKALQLQHCTRDVVAQYLYPDEGSWVPTFSLEGREHLKGVRVAPPDLMSYKQLIGGLAQ